MAARRKRPATAQELEQLAYAREVARPGVQAAFDILLTIEGERLPHTLGEAYSLGYWIWQAKSAAEAALRRLESLEAPPKDASGG